MNTTVLGRLAKRALGYLPFIVCIAALAASASLSEFALRNLAVQLLLFLFAASIPALLTGKMSFVDVAWPWGLTAIGAQALIWGDGWAPRQLLIATMSPFMYWVLVHYTGAVPAEHFSLEKRPAYSAYQRRTNRFFPGGSPSG